MNNVLKINFRRPKRLTGLLGLALDGSRLDGVVLKRTNGSLQISQNFSVTLTLDPLTAAPELVGREIRNQLDAAGVRERSCVVAVPLKWTLTAVTELPPLPAADAASLLQIEAERAFPMDAAMLRVADSRCVLAGDKRHITLAAIPAGQLSALEQVLAAAKLKPLSFTLATTALQPARSDLAEGVLALVIGENHVGLQIIAGGGIAALRALEGAVENEGGRRALHAETIAREVRITLGQLPPELRATVKRIRIFGPRELAQQLADEMELRFEPAGLRVEIVSAWTPGEFGLQIPAEAPLSPAFGLAARFLAGQKPAFEFLPPKPTLMEQLVTKYSSGKLRTIGAVAAGLVAITLGLFLFQQIELIMLRSQWSKMSARVTELAGIQDQIQKYRPWFDTSFRSLTILKQVTTAFPEDGAVTAKSFQIHDGSDVTCTGTASDNTALLKMLNQLRSTQGVSELKVEQIRGKSPMQFTFDLKFGTGGGHED
jgi:hypothetical protein